MKLPTLPADKANHALYGAVLFIAGAMAATLAGAHDLATVAGLSLAAAAGCAKEAADRLANRRAAAAGLPAPHGVELLDFAYTLAGAALCALAAWVVAA